MESRRRRKIEGVEPSDKAERFYRAQLASLVRLMAKELAEEINPALKRLKSEYIGDSWSDDIVSIIRRVSERFTTSLFQAQAERIARRTLSMADADNAADFLRSVNAAVGIQFPRSSKLDAYLDAALNENVALIRDVSDEYFRKVERLVLDNMRAGFTPTKIAKDIQAQTGSTYKRAKLIARDQMAKLNSDLSRQRQADAGVEFYRSSHSNDSRVSGKPGGKYPNAKISCYAIANRDIGYGKGVYRLDKGADYAGETGLHPGRHHVNCRCVAIPILPGINYFPKVG